MRLDKKVLLSLGVISALLSTNTFADELIVADCNGATRAAEQIETGMRKDLLLTLATPVNGIKATLSNSVTNEKKLSTSTNSGVLFKAVSAGKWNFCLASDNATVEKVAFIAPEGSTSSIKTALVGAGVLGGGIAAAIGNSGSNGSDSSASETFVNVAKGNSVPSNIMKKTDNNSVATTSEATRRRPRVLAQECSPEVEPTPISVFE